MTISGIPENGIPPIFSTNSISCTLYELICCTGGNNGEGFIGKNKTLTKVGPTEFFF